MINLHVFLLTKCDYLTDPDNRRRFAISVTNGEPVNGKFREGVGPTCVCELGFGTNIIYHPSVCQANGEWTQSTCKGSRFAENVHIFNGIFLPK